MESSVIRSILEKYGSPVYLYDGKIIEEQYYTLKNSMPAQFDILYSMKANPLLGICEKLKRLGSGIEVASSGELYTALQAGFPPSDIVFTSPGKTSEELDYAIQSGIYCINIESVKEAEIINQIALKYKRKVDIAIRINPNFDVSGASIKMAGVPTQLGIDQEQLDDAFKTICSLKNVSIIGIHVYTGTQILDADNIISNIGEIFKLAVDISSNYGKNIKFLDLGGGFGIPYFKNEMELAMERVTEGVSQIWRDYKSFFPETRIAVESGRYLIADAGSFITKILYRKECKGRMYLVCDGGSNLHANSAFLGRFVRNNFPMHILDGMGSEEEVYVSGPLCTPTDIIGQRVLLPKADTGDYLVVEKSGAYGLTNSPAFFLAHPLPYEILYDRGKSYILREKGGKEDYLTGQKSFVKYGK